MDNAVILIIVAGIAVAVITLMVDKQKYKREHYGGPIKNIRKIPLSECRDICMQNYHRCMADRSSMDAHSCSVRYQACLNNCQYTDFHRL